MCQAQLQARQRINSFNSHSTTMRQALLLPLSQTWGHRGAQRTWSITERAQTLLREAQSQHERLTPLSLFVIQFPLTFPPVYTFLIFFSIELQISTLKENQHQRNVSIGHWGRPYFPKYPQQYCCSSRTFPHPLKAGSLLFLPLGEPEWTW